MSALQIQVSNLKNGVASGQLESPLVSAAGSAKKSAGDPFASLLDVLGNSNEAVNVSRKDEEKDSKVALIEKPQDFREKIATSSSKDADKDDAQPIERKQSQQGNKTSDDRREATEHLTFKTSKVSEKADIKSKKSSEAVAGSDAADLEEGEKQTDTTDNIANLINLLADFINQNITTAAIPQSQNNAVNEANVTDAIDLSSGVTRLAATLGDISEILEKLKQFLQDANAQNAPLSEQQLSTLQGLNESLQADLNSLRGLLDSEVSFDGKDGFKEWSGFDLSALKDSNHSPEQEKNSDLTSSIEADIEQIRDMLQKYRDNFSGNNITITSEEDKTSGVSKDVSPAILSNSKEGDSSLAVAVSTLVAGADEQTNTTQNTNNSQSLSLLSGGSQALSTNLDAQTNSGGNSGQGGSGAPFGIAALSSSANKLTGEAASNQFSTLLNRTSQAPVTEQVAFQIKNAVGNGDSKITIQLNPHELGKLDITLNVDSDGNTGVVITADNKQTLDLLQRDSQSLQKALTDAGLKSDSASLSFNLRGGEREGQGQNQSQAASQYKKSQPEELVAEEINIAAVTRSYVVNVPDGLNIKI